MKKVSSVSGGKTSSYMAIHFPADEYIFSAVLTDDKNCVIQDKSLRNYAKHKLPWFDWDKKGSRELDLTLHNLRKLEQLLGQNIKWVAAPFTFDELISGDIYDSLGRCYSRGITSSQCLPNQRQRFCTQALKLYPIFWECYLTGDKEPIIMDIGFRYDENKRVERWNCKNDTLNITRQCDIKGQYKNKHRHEEIEWRIPNFPLYENKITKEDIYPYWDKKGVKFPKISNCDGCFFHLVNQHIYQNQHYPERMNWWMEWEKKVGKTFGKTSLEKQLKSKKIAPLKKGYEPSNEFSCLCTD